MTPRLLFLPGMGGGSPQHWYSLWQAKFGGVRVEQADWNAPTPESWAARLNEAVEATPGEVVLVGHSAGALTIAHYARLYTVPERVRGALLVAPADAEQGGMLEAVRAMAPIPRQPLPFPALMIASENDPYLTFERAGAFAEAWEAELVTVGEAGHINPESGHGEWEDGEILLSEALHAWTPPDIVRF
ncbi:serine hydrolase family protein [Deinococcus psychrotolerans]|uniref:Serine hydrolase family protein n=1 Tax=Deinococcus psychrotolerans TaxID=2489213 RepID=A0A3G8YCY8_9DEIO|nr:alpha/beta fold hydrolase [Deinococcus psychrotolerans]AZI43182.1 serine hydrolase family protein [Deinococcus psychrotolerans]